MPVQPRCLCYWLLIPLLQWGRGELTYGDLEDESHYLYLEEEGPFAEEGGSAHCRDTYLEWITLYCWTTFHATVMATPEWSRCQWEQIGRSGRPSAPDRSALPRRSGAGSRVHVVPGHGQVPGESIASLGFALRRALGRRAPRLGNDPVGEGDFQTSQRCRVSCFPARSCQHAESRAHCAVPLVRVASRVQGCGCFPVNGWELPGTSSDGAAQH
nr:uncharacterized protein LOC122172543 [Chrysemys picta bellii]